MSQRIESPLLTVMPDENNGLSAWTTLGIVLQIAMEHDDLNQRTVGDWMQRLLPALETGQCQILLDERSRPWAFASWIAANNEQHQRWLAGDSTLPDPWHKPTDEGSDLYLWIVDFIVPFGNQLQALRSLRGMFPGYDAAWTFNLNNHEQQGLHACQPLPQRRLW